MGKVKENGDCFSAEHSSMPKVQSLLRAQHGKWVSTY
jgi:hypothetical protein